METILSEASKAQLEDHIRIDGLSEAMLDSVHFSYFLKLSIAFN